MDSIKDKLSNISLYDVKAYVRKAQNAVFNYTEMEAKVREATNNEPWGASSTLMQEIAEGTQSYSQFHEIMPMIYKRFTEKSAEEWRQIYKALQLLEFLVKNGSERVVDYARSHIAVIDMLKHFHYIDSNGKDQGINVRNRAKELMALLSDVNKIRSERKQAKANRAKFGGISSGSGSSGGFGNTGSRYGGFGSNDSEYGGYAGGVYGDGGGFGGNEYEGPGYTRGSRATEPSYGSDDFEEYEVETTATTTTAASSRAPRASQQQATPSTKEPAKDLFSFDEEPSATSYSAPSAAAAPASADDDDDFADFQSAAAPSSTPAATKPLPQQPSDPLAGLFSSANTTNTTSHTTSSLNFSSFQPQSSSTYTPPAFNSNTASSNGNYNGSANYDAFGPLTSASTSASTTTATSSATAQSKPKAADAFSSLWTSTKSKTTPAKTSAPLATLAQKNAESKMWGNAPSNGSNNNNNNNGGSIDLLSL